MRNLPWFSPIRPLSLGFLVFVLLGLPQAGMALPRGNPVPHLKSGQFALQVNLGTTTHPITISGWGVEDAKLNTTTGLFQFGAGDTSMIELQVGSASASVAGGAASSGTFFGFGYHQLVGNPSSSPELGVLLKFTTRSDKDFEAYQADVGFGVSGHVSDGLRWYGAGAYSPLWGWAGGVEYWTDTPFALYGGLEMETSPNMTLGAEVSLVVETSFHAFVTMAF
ncbi:MAG: hypothetical protein OEV94_11180 [Deltaproteobacteria bacterium]|nr:hypothetical protein [Deltaproteobacteria bacterium]